MTFARHLLRPFLFLTLTVWAFAPAIGAHHEEDGAAPLALTTYGMVRGATEAGVHVFKGVRYGADTSGTRFQRANAPQSWAEVKDALAFGNVSPQTPFSNAIFASWARDVPEVQSEDLLFLNVWTPGTDDRKRPVMVWFHGGGFSAGSGGAKAYDGVNLANRGDVVVVTVNHRLNAFGYLDLTAFGPDYADSANVGSLDMVMSLEWVRDNIAAFGGNPENVTIFGESGGGGKVTQLMMMDAADGLFHRAIVQSGSQFRAFAQDDARESATRLMGELDVADAVALAALPAADITSAIEALEAKGEGIRFGFVHDGTTVTRDRSATGTPAVSADVPLLIGTTADEMRLFMAADQSNFAATFDDLPDRLAAFVPAADVKRVIAEYRRLMPDASAADILFTAASDVSFRAGAVEAALARAADDAAAPVWVYQLNWGSPILGGALGAMHALDIAFMFDNAAYSESIAGPADDSQIMAEQMSEAWIAFARHGNPNARGLPYWPEFSGETREAMIFDEESEVESGYFETRSTLFSSLPPPR